MVTGGRSRIAAAGRTGLFPLVLLGLFLLSPPRHADAAVLEVLSSDATTRTVLHELGETVTPRDPQRIVALHNIFAEAALLCGRVPVGLVEHGRKVPQHLEAALAGVQSVGQQGAPDFEMILSLRPDLILATATVYRQSYPLLSAIAPSILIDEPKDDWRPWLLSVGRALGCELAVAEGIEAYDRRASEVGNRLRASHAGETVLVLRVREKDIRIYGGGRRSGPVLYRDLGLTPHRLTPLEEDSLTISNEMIPQLTADHIFLMVEDAGKMQGLQATTLWRNLPAVRAGHVYDVDIEPWNRSSGPLSFRRIVDDVDAFIVGPK